mgnify:CR=1 FL=1
MLPGKWKCIGLMLLFLTVLFSPVAASDKPVKAEIEKLGAIVDILEDPGKREEFKGVDCRLVQRRGRTGRRTV